MKTNKSFTKRLKVTKNGKILMRGKGQNHFNAKARRRAQLGRKRMVSLHMKKGDIARFLPNA
ncbi:MAG: 50S ribosomal protein L35 [bacterium]|nr:50S ribosomal protein L35 [bacterium]